MEDARRVTGRVFSRSIVLDRTGFWVLLLDDDVVAYVPKTERRRVALARERRVLARIATRVSFPVPKPIGKLDAPIDVRAMVRGRAGGEARADAVPWMARSLAELHGSLTVLELDAFGVEPPGPEVDGGIDSHLDGEDAKRAHAIAAEYKARIVERDVRRDVLCHGDFGTHNFTHDDAGLPNGVFDFHDIVRAPRWFDVRYVPSYGEDALREALAIYRVDERDVRLAHAGAALESLAWRAHDPDAHDTKSGRDRAGAIAWVKTAIARLS